MKSFIFRLERIFQLRAKLERQRAESLASAVRLEQDQREALEQANTRLDRVAAVNAAGSAIQNAGTLRNRSITVEAAAKDIEAAQRSHREAVDSVEAKAEEFGKARMERRVLERLRERRQEAWTVEAGREEQREIDGLAGSRHDAGRDAK